MRRHVHEVEVFLTDVMHRPVSGQPQNDQANAEGDPIPTACYRRAGVNSLRADHSHRVEAERNGAEDDQPDFGVRLESPDVGVCREQGAHLSTGI